jgi:hypothetical protein
MAQGDTMSAPITLLIVTSEASAPFELQLEPQLAQCMQLLEARGAGDELLLIDNSGTGELARAAQQRFPPSATFEGARAELRALARPKIVDPRAAELAGAQAAACDRVLLLETGATLESASLDKLIAALVPGIAASTPREATRARYSARWSATELLLEPGDPWNPGLSELCVLFRREDFLRLGGYDPLFGRGGLSGLELFVRMQRAGLALAVPPGTRVESSRTARTDEPLWRERERHLLNWRELVSGPDGEARWQQHIRLLEDRALELMRREARVELLGLNLALADAPRMLAAQAAQVAQSS